MELKFSIETDEFLEELKKEEKNVLVRVERVAELIALEIVNYARDHGSYGSQPPAKAGEGPRRAHPGGWADITGNLANSIKGHVETDGLKVTAVIRAIMEYAEYLDNKTGYDVLGGAEVIARKAIKKHAPKIFEE